MRQKTALTIGLVILGCFLGLACVAVCGLVFIEKALRLPEVITAEYPGIRLWGQEADGEWTFSDMFVQPTDSLDANAVEFAEGVLIRLGHQPPVPIREVTPEMLDKYLREVNSYSRPTSPDGMGGPGGPYMIEFRAGAVRSAQYSRYEKGISFIKGDKEFTLPVSRKDVESVFGKPTSIKITEDHWR